jgi:hypothetical protein
MNGHFGGKLVGSGATLSVLASLFFGGCDSLTLVVSGDAGAPPVGQEGAGGRQPGDPGPAPAADGLVPDAAVSIPSEACGAHACDGLGTTGDAKLCPDGTGVGRNFCTRSDAGVCHWDFPPCPPGPVVPPAGANAQCPLVAPSDASMPAAGCSLVGRWRLDSNHGIVTSNGVIEFTDVGSYYGGPSGTDLSKTYAYDGAYEFAGTGSKGTFKLVFSCGDGCNGGGTFDVEFKAGCAFAILTENLTTCTGNRIAVAGNVVLTRM